MENKIYYVSSEEMQCLKTEFNKKKDIFIVEIDGNLIQNEREFLDTMTEKFKFPYSVNGLDGYLDWIRDLDWIEKPEYILIINNFRNFLKNEPIVKKNIVHTFEDTVLPWWEKEVENCVVEGKAKAFNVYFAD